MRTESAPISQHKSLESLKTVFKERLNSILYKPLTVENIETFADNALDEAVQLSADILREYRNNPNVHAGVDALGDAEQEDKACEILGLQNINEILDSINAIKSEIDSLRETAQKNTEKVDVVMTPPQELEVKIHNGDGSGMEKKKIFPRLLTLLYIIKHDFNIDPVAEKVLIKEGIVTPNMIRKNPYVRVEVPELDRAIYLCNEEGNASYIFDTKKLEQAQLTLDEIDIDDKGDKNSLIAYHSGIGCWIRQSLNWRSRVSGVLGEPIPETQAKLKEVFEIQEREKISPDVRNFNYKRYYG